MYRWNGYMAGANLGHWISQYNPNVRNTPEKRRQHWDTYITEPDFARMASWGLDHVRLPVDYFLFESDEQPGEYMESGLQYVDFVVKCCKKYGLNLVLDLHHAPGFTFNNKFDETKNNLFTSAAQQKRFIAIWEMFSRRYAGTEDYVAFEFLNEIVLKDTAPWNDLWQRTLEAVRAISPTRNVVVGSNLWNSVDELKNLVVVDDPHVIYNFHFYLPFAFTHQRANWEPHMAAHTQPVAYPLRPLDHEEWVKEYFPDYLAHDVLDKEYLRSLLLPAKEFIEKHGRPLYCGEYGVISHAALPDTVRWLEDIADLFGELGIGRAVWSYRGFANVTDANNEVVSDEIIHAISRR